MKSIAKIAIALAGCALLTAPAAANWKHHRHDCGWGKHHHKKC